MSYLEAIGAEASAARRYYDDLLFKTLELEDAGRIVAPHMRKRLAAAKARVDAENGRINDAIGVVVGALERHVYGD